MSGRPLYATTEYASAFGCDLIDLEEWKSALLVRPIADSNCRDALGCYPLAAIARDADLCAGIKHLREAGMLSVALVPDPLAGPDFEDLAAAFSICRAFKRHYVVDRENGTISFPTTHRRWIRKASRLCSIVPVRLGERLPEWVKLYEQIIARHQPNGIQRFAPSYFAALAQLDGVDAFAAVKESEVVAMALWVRSGSTVYYHLGASAAEGYRAQAMYGIIAAAIEYYRDYRFVHLGGGAGVNEKDGSGLSAFKRGFTNREITAYFCGSCLDEARYAELAANQPATSYFPAYRQP